MKKILLIVAICLIPLKAMSSSFVNTLGSECARILFNIESHVYPKFYEQLENRNSQFYALEQCLKLYDQSGGDLKKLDTKYVFAREITLHDSYICELNKKETNKDCEYNHQLFKDIIVDGYCGISALIKNKYPNFDIAMKMVVETLCQKEIEEATKNLNQQPLKAPFEGLYKH